MSVLHDPKQTGIEVGSLSYMSVIHKLERAFTDSSESSLPRGIVEFCYEEEADAQNKVALAALLYRSTVLKWIANPETFNFKDISALYSESHRAGCPYYVAEALNYLRLYQVLGIQLRKLDMSDGETWFGGCTLEKAAAPLIAAVEGVDNFEPGCMSSKLVMGKLRALGSREVATRLFDDATEGLERDLGGLPT